jgi:flagellar basal-body rod modification protein FlgD
MPAPAAQTNAASPTPSGTTSSPVQDVNNMFLQLLTAQLQSQSPLDPLDPNQFVAQLAQFDSLSELTQINQTLQQLIHP